MSVQNGSKLNRLILSWPKGAVYTTEWMVEQGFSRSLINKYKKGHWLSSIVRGAYTLPGDKGKKTGQAEIFPLVKYKIYALNWIF
jgi:hypothetical protein